MDIKEKNLFNNIRLRELEQSRMSRFIDKTNWINQIGNFSLAEIFNLIKIVDVEDKLKDNFIEKLTQAEIKLEDDVSIKEVTYPDIYFKNLNYILNLISFRELFNAILRTKINIEGLYKWKILFEIDKIKRPLLAIGVIKELEKKELLGEIPLIFFHLSYENKYLIDTNGIIYEKASNSYYIYNYNLDKKKLAINEISSQIYLKKDEYNINYKKKTINFSLNKQNFNLLLKECNIIQTEEDSILLTNKLEGKIILLENLELKEEIDIEEESTSKEKLTSSDLKENNSDYIKIENKKYKIIRNFELENKNILILKGTDKKKMIAFLSPNKKIVLKNIIIDLGFICFIQNGKYIIGYDWLGREFILKGNISQKSIANGEKILVSELEEKNELLKVIKVTVKTNRKQYRKRNKDDEEVKDFVVNRNAYIIFYDSGYVLIDYHIKDKRYLNHNIDKIILKNITNDFAKFVVCISSRRKKENLYFSSIITKELNTSNSCTINFDGLSDLKLEATFKTRESYNKFLETGKIEEDEEDFNKREEERKERLNKTKRYVKKLYNPKLRAKLEGKEE